MPESSPQLPASPDGLELRGRPLASARLSKKAALAACAAVALVLGVIVTNVSRENAKHDESGQDTAKALEPALNAARTLTGDVADQVVESVPRAPPQLSAAPAPSPSNPAPLKNTTDDARLADTAVQKFSSHASAGAALTVALQGGNRSASAMGLAPSGLMNAANDEPAHEPDLNRQAQKQAFLQKSRDIGYLKGDLRAPLTPFELKAGTVIPSISISEINSDLPGDIIAQVSQNVYDSATGKHLLIPQGSKLFGRYDSQVAFGQERLLVSWHRLIYPNAHTLDLGGMAGHDQEGKAGFTDRVNNHYGRIFGWALLTSVLSAAYQQSQPAQHTFNNQLTNQQAVGAAVGQQVAQLGVEMARHNMRVQPTIEVRKGYRLNVMVSKDIVFPGAYGH